jgi:hypothetical protein
MLAHAAVIQHWGFGGRSNTALPAEGGAMQTRIVSLPLASPLDAPSDSVVQPTNEVARPLRAVPFSAATERVASRGTAVPTLGGTQAPHLPTAKLDIGPMPRSSPDDSRLEGSHRSGLPMRVRLFVDAGGAVSRVDVLSSAPGDEETAQRVAMMFRETAFTPGRLDGRDVASFIDIEIVLDPDMPATVPLTQF